MPVYVDGCYHHDDEEKVESGHEYLNTVVVSITVVFERGFKMIAVLRNRNICLQVDIRYVKVFSQEDLGTR